jgi:23S rRNA (cytosine1962-C5)-methyltransferase
VAFEGLLRPFVEERVLADDGELLVVDKPPGLPVHGGGEGLDLVTRLGHWLAAQGRDRYLGVHQRLDQDASGVLVFALTESANQLLAREIPTHSARRSYVAGVTLRKGRKVSDSGVLEHQLEQDREGRMRVVAHGGQRAISHYRVVERAGERALVDVRLETGRTHQIRAQLAHAGMPIAGDRLYGSGASASRLLLHARELELTEPAKRFSAAAPRAFADFLRGGAPELARGEELRRSLLDAGSRRWPLDADHSAFRLVNDLGDGLPDVTVDRYGDFAVLAVSEGAARDRAPELAALLVDLGARGVYLKIRARADLRRADRAALAPEQPVAGEAAPPEIEARECDLSIVVRLADGLSTGLFVDQRDNRRRLLAEARGKRVLNLFSYTCSFSVAAALGGAASTVSIDLSSRALERGRENFAKNGIAPGAQHRLFREEAKAWLARARRRGDQFDFIVLDPPTFASAEGKQSFRSVRDYAEVARDALCLLASSGALLAVTNHRGTGQEELRRILRRAAAMANRRVTQLKDLASQLDCPPIHGQPHPSRSVLVRVA